MRTFPARSLASREQTHRRRLLLGIGALLLLSVSPVFGHHLVRGAETLLSGTDHIGELCLVALHIVLAPVHESIHLLVVAGLAYAAWDRLRAWRRMRSVLSGLDGAPPVDGDGFSRAAATAGVPSTLIRIVPGLPNPAFTAGFRRPIIYVAAELEDALSPAQLAAVLAHEHAHVSRRDPLRLSVLRFFSRTLFWLPAFRRLSDDLADEAEIMADDHAAGDRPLVLASAILAVARLGCEEPVIAVPGFTRCDILERRVRRLAGEDTTAHSHVTRRSIASAAAALLLVWASGVVMAHPLGAQSYGQHQTGQQHESDDCTRHPGPVFMHLVCDGFPFRSAAGDCPHHRV